MLIIPRDFGPKKGKIFDEDLDDSKEGWKEAEEGDEDEDEDDWSDVEEEDDSTNEGDWEESDEDIDFDE